MGPYFARSEQAIVIEMLNKIGAIAKAVGIDDAAILPKAEPHCNCMHCQIARAIHSSISGEEDSRLQQQQEEEVTSEDLKFRLWDINQTADNLYIVSNPLALLSSNPNELQESSAKIKV